MHIGHHMPKRRQSTGFQVVRWHAQPRTRAQVPVLPRKIFPSGNLGGESVLGLAQMPLYAPRGDVGGDVVDTGGPVAAPSPPGGRPPHHLHRHPQPAPLSGGGSGRHPLPPPLLPSTLSPLSLRGLLTAPSATGEGGQRGPCAGSTPRRAHPRAGRARLLYEQVAKSMRVVAVLRADVRGWQLAMRLETQQ